MDMNNDTKRLVTEEEIQAIIKDVTDRLAEKGARQMEVLPVTEQTTVADYFIVCTGTSNTHLRTLSQEVEQIMETKYNLRAHHIEGYETAQWILVDYVFMVVHLFRQDVRDFYSLERLWKA